MQIDIMFLFEHTGLAALPFEERGMKCLVVDIKNSGANQYASYSFGGDILEHIDELHEMAKECRLVVGFPECTHLAASGAKHFQDKLSQDPLFQLRAEQLFMTVPKIAGNTTYMVENPRGVMSGRWRPPDYVFDPYEYGGYLPFDDIHPLYPKYIAPRDAYTKETCLWTSPDFRMPPKKPVVPEPGMSRQTRLLGGKSEKTKTIRSASPRGFFTALAEEYS